MKLLALALMLLVCVSSNAQNKKISPKYLKEDLDLLKKVIVQNHPGYHQFISKDNLIQKFDSVINSITDSLSESEFHIIVRKTIKNLHCGHTVAKPSTQWYKENRGKPMLPLKVEICNNKVSIERIFNQNQEGLGNELISINSIPVEKIVDDIKQIHNSDGYGNAHAENAINTIFSTYHAFLYGIDTVYKIEYRGVDNSIHSRMIQASKGNVSKEITNKEYKFCLEGPGASLNYDIGNKAQLKINSFEQRGYKKFYKSVFKTIKDSGLSELELVLVNNGGGYFPNAMTLLSYLAKEKPSILFFRNRKLITDKNLSMDKFSKLTKHLFDLQYNPQSNSEKKYFKKTYRLKQKYHFDGIMSQVINGGTFSMSSFVAAYLKNKLNVTTYGSESGGGECGSNGILMSILKLPNSKIQVYVPMYHVDHQLKDVKPGKGVIPKYIKDCNK